MLEVNFFPSLFPSLEAKLSGSVFLPSPEAELSGSDLQPKPGSGVFGFGFSQFH
jgi:hypothetical protein